MKKQSELINLLKGMSKIELDDDDIKEIKRLDNEIIKAQIDRTFKAKRLDNGKWITGWFTKKEIGSLIVPVIEIYKEWDTGDYIETYEIDGETLTNI